MKKSLGMDLDYDAIAVLSAVIRTGSFEAAARELNVTQSAVSQRVRALEERYGSILVIRGRPCVATEEARLLCQHFDQILLMQHELRMQMETVGRSSPLAMIRLRIGVNNDSLATWFPEIVRTAQDDLNIRLELLPDDQDHTEESLRTGEALAVVTSNPKPVPGCRRTSLGAMEYMAVATPDFVKRQLKGEISPARVASAPSIVFDRKDTLPEQWMLASFGESVSLSSHMIPSYEGHLGCCLQGVGWCIMPTMTVGPLVAAGTLVELVARKRVLVSLHWQSRSQQSDVLKNLTDIVTKVAAKRLVPDQFQANP